MKNIQVIDEARNCSYDVFAIADEDFRALFPQPHQDIEFAEDFFARLGEADAEEIYGRLWSTRLNKKALSGIDGTLFVGLEWKRIYYPTKREDEMITGVQ